MEDPTVGMDVSLNQSTFLPQLKELRSDICWGSSWYLLENISNLVSLHLAVTWDARIKDLKIVPLRYASCKLANSMM